MDRILDLDAVARLMEVQRQRLSDAGYAVGPLTWRDGSDAWPQELKTRREEVSDPDSVGLKLVTPGPFAETVVFRGGWADAFWGSGAGPDDATWHSPPELADLAAVERLLDAAFRDFLVR